MKNIAIMMLQLALSQMKSEDGDAYYGGAIDGVAGTLTRAAVGRLAKDWGLIPEQAESVPETNQTQTMPEQTVTMPENAVLVFSLAEDGERYVSEHFQVKEFACNDNSDVVLIHPLLPVWAEALRTINGAFRPNSAYRTVSYNASIKDASPKSKHCWGIAMDVPAVNATPEELYDLALTLVGDTGGLGIYPWGIHIDCREVKSRWDSR